MKTVRKYDKETGRSEVVVIADGIIGKGVAVCCDEDKDFQTQGVGLTVAEYKAMSNFYIKKALKEFDTIIYLENRYKNSYELAAFVGKLELTADKYIKKALQYEEMLEVYINVKDNFYRKLEAIKNGTQSTMEYHEDLTDLLSEEMKASINEGMKMEIEKQIPEI